jgi:hypothetical protein
MFASSHLHEWRAAHIKQVSKSVSGSSQLIKVIPPMPPPAIPCGLEKETSGFALVSSAFEKSRSGFFS